MRTPFVSTLALSSGILFVGCSSKNESTEIPLGLYEGTSASGDKFAVKIVKGDDNKYQVESLSYEFIARPAPKNISLKNNEPFGVFEKGTLSFEFPVAIGLYLGT